MVSNGRFTFISYSKQQITSLCAFLVFYQLFDILFSGASSISMLEHRVQMFNHTNNNVLHKTFFSTVRRNCANCNDGRHSMDVIQEIRTDSLGASFRE